MRHETRKQKKKTNHIAFRTLKTWTSRSWAPWLYTLHAQNTLTSLQKVYTSSACERPQQRLLFCVFAGLHRWCARHPQSGRQGIHTVLEGSNEGKENNLNLHWLQQPLFGKKLSALTSNKVRKCFLMEDNDGGKPLGVCTDKIKNAELSVSWIAL